MKTSNIWKDMVTTVVGLVLNFIWWFLLIQISTLSGSGLPGTSAQKLWRRWPDSGEPTLAETIINKTVVSGRVASMPCRVANLGDKTVSWIRGIDLTVLAVDRITYTGDQRFTVKHYEDTNDWFLELRDVTSADEGLYDCQINTHPKLSTKVYLHVVSRHAAEASLFDMTVSDTGMTLRRGGGNRKKHLFDHPIYSESTHGARSDMTVHIRSDRLIHKNIGDALKLTCQATGKGVDLFVAARPKEERLLGWKLDSVPVESLFPEWKVKIQETTTADSGIESEMTLEYLASEDSGKISCFVPGVDSTFVNLHIVEEKTTDQHYSGSSTNKIQKDPHKHPYQLTSAVSAANNPVAGSGCRCTTTNILSVILVLLSLINTSYYKVP